MHHRKKTVYVIIQRYILAGKSEEFTARIRREFVPIIERLPGFKSLYLVDHGGHTLIAIGFWETKVAATRSIAEARQWIFNSALGLAPFLPEKFEGDIVLEVPPFAV
jgi:hypothetical protein